MKIKTEFGGCKVIRHGTSNTIIIEMTYLEEVEQGKVEYVTKIYSFEDHQGEDMSEALYRAYNL